MQTFIGTKIIKALPMNRANYNMYRGWDLPKDENGLDDGYLVEYTDGGKSNHTQHDGYISWSPKEQFDNTYRETSGITFGLAVEAMKKGAKISRKGWNGKTMYVYQIQEFSTPEGYKYRAHMNLKTADGSIATWAPSCSDALADDWRIVP